MSIIDSGGDILTLVKSGIEGTKQVLLAINDYRLSPSNLSPNAQFSPAKIARDDFYFPLSVSLGVSSALSSYSGDVMAFQIPRAFGSGSFRVKELHGVTLRGSDASITTLSLYLRVKYKGDASSQSTDFSIVGGTWTRGTVRKDITGTLEVKAGDTLIININESGGATLRPFFVTVWLAGTLGS